MSSTGTLQPKRYPELLQPGIEFYAHQVEGIRWARKRRSFVLADDMGLGKTIQSLTAVALDVEAGKASKILVICGAGVIKQNWAHEIAKMTKLSYMVLPNGSAPKRLKALAEWEESDTQILIINAEQIHSHFDFFIGPLVETEDGKLDVDPVNASRFDIVIVDECHRFSNPRTRKTIELMLLTPKRWMFLTGTPINNAPDDLWVPLKLVYGDKMPSYPGWKQRYCTIRNERVVGIKNQTEFRNMVDPIMLRRLKKDCLDLPDKVFVQVQCTLSPLQRQLYNEALAELRARQAKMGPVTRQNSTSGLAATTRFRQVSCTPACLEDYEDRDESDKLDAVMAYVEDLHAAGEPCIVFTNFHGVVDAMGKRCKKAGIPSWWIDGRVPDNDERFRRIQEWEKSGAGVLIGTIKTMGEGLNLVHASYALMVDRWYKPGSMTQAEDRIYRIGMDPDKPATIVEFISEGYEYQIEQILDRKGRMIDEAIPNSGWTEKVYSTILESDEV